MCMCIILICIRDHEFDYLGKSVKLMSVTMVYVSVLLIILVRPSRAAGIFMVLTVSSSGSVDLIMLRIV